MDHINKNRQNEKIKIQYTYQCNDIYKEHDKYSEQKNEKSLNAKFLSCFPNYKTVGQFESFVNDFSGSYFSYGKKVEYDKAEFQMLAPTKKEKQISEIKKLVYEFKPLEVRRTASIEGFVKKIEENDKNHKKNMENLGRESNEGLKKDLDSLKQLSEKLREDSKWDLDKALKNLESELFNLNDSSDKNTDSERPTSIDEFPPKLKYKPKFSSYEQKVVPLGKDSVAFTSVDESKKSNTTESEKKEKKNKADVPKIKSKSNDIEKSGNEGGR